MTDDAPFVFDQFSLDPQDARLIGPDGPIRIGNKALAVLEALIAAEGRLITKDQLFDSVWDGMAISESALTSVIKELRRALGDTEKPPRFIESVYGRGYRFCARVGRTGDTPPAAPREASGPAPALPRPAATLLGRDADLAAIVDRLDRHALVTIVGPGGMGKTRAGLEIAWRQRDRHEHGVWFVELAPLTRGQPLAEAVAKTLHIPLPAQSDPAAALVERLRWRQCLIVIDNAEHLIAEVARLATAICAACEGVRLLVTSQEPLGIAGEQLWRLPPLSAEEASALFLDRARAIDPGFGDDPIDRAPIERICARLDHLPLAIEMAAARAPMLGGEELLARLGDRFALLTGGRTAEPRHRTLTATLAWSHDLLNDAEARVFRRLGVFTGSFSLRAAAEIASDDDLPPELVVEVLAALVARSLVALQSNEGRRRYRLLETMRAFALAKLAEADEEAAWRRRHAAWFADAAEAIFPDFCSSMTDAELTRRHRAEFDNINAAIDWAYGPGGDRELGHQLVAGSAHLRTDRPLKALLDRAIAQLGPATAAPIRARLLGQRLHVLMRLKPAAALEVADEALAAVRSASNDPWILIDTLSSKGFAYWFTGKLPQARAISNEIQALLPRGPLGRIGVLGQGLEACVVLSEAGPAAARPLFAAMVAELRAIGADGLAHFWEMTALRFELDEDLDAAIDAWRDLFERVQGTAEQSHEIPCQVATELAGRLARRGTAADLEEALRIARDQFRLNAMAFDYLAFLPMVCIAAKQGRAAEAAMLLGYAEARRRQAGESMMTKRDFREARETLAAALPPETLDALTEQGSRLAMHAAVELALGAPAARPLVTA